MGPIMSRSLFNPSHSPNSPPFFSSHPTSSNSLIPITTMYTNYALVSSNYVLTPNPLLTNQLSVLPTKSLLIPKYRSKSSIFAFSNTNITKKSNLYNQNSYQNGKKFNGVELFAATSMWANKNSTRGNETVTVGVNPHPYSSPPSQFGSPLFWIGVGVGFSALFSFVAAKVKNYAMQQALKTVMGQMGSQNNQFGSSGFPTGSPFGFPPPSTSGMSTPSGFPYKPPSTSGPNTSTGFTYSPSSSASGSNTSVGSASSATVDVLTTKSEGAEPRVKDETQVKTEAKKFAFVDVSPEEAQVKSPFEDFNESSTQTPPGDPKFAEVVQNGAALKETSNVKEGKTGSVLSVEALEKMMEDPNVQKMVYPHLPEEMRNPTTFKWMLQNPLYRQQLQEMLDNMGGSSEWDQQMVDTLQNFNFESPEVKQQFDQLGLSPEEVISKIMANPDVALAFQNPRVQQAILDCSQNPLNITKYQNDQEVMSVFNKISELFPGAGGPGAF